MKKIIKSENLSKVLNRRKRTNGVFTVKSLKTGKDFTFKIKKNKYKNKWYIHLYVEIEYLNFKRLGCYFNGKIYNKNSNTNTKACKTISFILNKVENEEFEFLDNNIEIMHIGKCIACGKILTDSESIKRGLGPICDSLN